MRTGNAKSCEPEPAGLEKAILAERRCASTDARPGPVGGADQPVDGRASRVSVALVAAKRSRTCRSHAMSRARRIRFAPMVAPRMASSGASRPKAADVTLNPSHAPTRALPAPAANPVAFVLAFQSRFTQAR